MLPETMSLESKPPTMVLIMYYNIIHRISN